MLWLALALPHLPLDRLERGMHEAAPLAVLEETRRGPHVRHGNAPARARGVRAGMSLNAALALAPDLRYRPGDPPAEHAALERLAGWAGRFSPWVSVDAPAGLLMEIEGSLALFGALESLHRAVAEGVAALGYQAVIATAPFPRAASLLARAGRSVRVHTARALTDSLKDLPVAVLELAEAHRRALDELGLHRLGQLFALPRDGLARRFGPELVDLLDRLRGCRPDPQPRFVPPPTFRARLELPCPLQASEALLFACNRLLQELEGRLIAGAQGVEGFALVLHHDRRPATWLRQGLARPGGQARHGLTRVRTRLERTPLGRPVEALEVCADRLVARPGPTLDRFGGFPKRDGARWLEALQARLGAAAVQGLTLAADHRPERAWRRVRPGERGGGGVCPPRPLWLLPEPVALTDKPPSNWRLGGPERIESGWWDGADVSRDYDVAEGPDGQRWWLFQERRGGHRWFIHGLFA